MDRFDYTTAGDKTLATSVANGFVMLICKDGAFIPHAAARHPKTKNNSYGQEASIITGFEYTQS
jgi:hypothetical protein